MNIDLNSEEIQFIIDALEEYIILNIGCLNKKLKERMYLEEKYSNSNVNSESFYKVWKEIFTTSHSKRIAELNELKLKVEMYSQTP